MASVRSLIFKIYKSHGGSLTTTQGSVGIRSIELFSGGERLLIPGYPFGGVQAAGSGIFDDAPEITGGMFATEVAATSNPAWYRWTAPKSGTMTLNTVGYSDIDVYIGDTLGTLTPVTLNINNTSSVTFDVVSGQEYKIKETSSVSNSLRGALVEAYASVAGRDFQGWDGYIWSARSAFIEGRPWNSPKTDAFTRENSWLSETGLFDSGGYIMDGDYIQLVMVLPFTVECDQVAINNMYHSSYPDMTWLYAVREAHVYYSESEVSQAEAEDDSTPIPGEKFFGFATDIPRHTSSNVIDDFFIEEFIPSVLSAGIGLGMTAKAEYPFTKMNAGIGLGMTASGGCDIPEASVKAAIGLGFGADGESRKQTMKCGLALAASMSAQHTLLPTQLLTNLGLGMTAKAEQGQTIKCKAGLCIECLLKAERIPDRILQAGIALGAQMVAEQEYNSAVEGAIYLGCKMTAKVAIPPPCLAQEFQHLKWF